MSKSCGGATFGLAIEHLAARGIAGWFDPRNFEITEPMAGLSEARVLMSKVMPKSPIVTKWSTPTRSGWGRFLQGRMWGVLSGLGVADVTSLAVDELDPGPPLLTVVDLQGCAHADGFGQLDKLTLEQEWRLIEAALDAAIGEAS
jgi:hypothetical protein